MHFITIDNILLLVGILLFASVLVSKTSLRVGVPTLIFFVAIGILVGSEGLDLIEFNDYNVAQSIGVVALNFILFYGGFDTSWKEVKPVMWQGAALSVFGVLFTALTLGFFVYLVVPGFTIYEGMLLGSIVSSTDAAAVFSVLRSRGLSLRGGLRPMLEFESGSNDPMAYLLTLTFIHLVQNPTISVGSQILFFVMQMSIGVVMGFGMGWISKKLINRIRLGYEGLYAILVIALIFFTYSLTGIVKGNGFLAVYVFAIFIGNQKLMHKKTISKVFDGYAWLMQIVIFITLGVLVNPSQMLHVAGIGLLISAFLMFIARPVSVFLSLIPFKAMAFRSRMFVSWVGLKGAVPIVFATYPLVAGVQGAEFIFNIVFFVSVTSVLIQGTTLSKVAQWLHVSAPFKKQHKFSIDIELDEDAEELKSRFARVVLPDNSKAVGIPLLELGFPQKAAISLIIRGDKYITPYGATVLEPHDKLLIASEDATSMANALDCLGASPSMVEWEEL
ncbi:MAG: potassium/proton antiporter [Prevotellaceae bacterium]|jgi:cell volume regulation protein A|nr:potassium/proton antiporter [Prevotellaceae bacterium]